MAKTETLLTTSQIKSFIPMKQVIYGSKAEFNTEQKAMTIWINNKIFWYSRQNSYKGRSCLEMPNYNY